MHPALSVIFLTTLIGAGQGLFLAIYSAEVGAELGWLPAQDAAGFQALGSGLALALLGLGLLASFFHLGHPERAWRTASQWRTSWLSREVVVLPAFMAAVLWYGACHYLGWGGTVAVGAVGVVLCIALFVSTGMIYACVRFLQEWHTPLTVLNYFLLGTASGFVLAAGLAAMREPGVQGFLAEASLGWIAAAFLGRAASLVRNARLRPRSTLESAIGVRHRSLAQRSQGFMGGSFNTREFFHGRPEDFVRRMQWGFLILTFLVPALLLAVGLASSASGAILAAFPVQYAGLMAERWCFFAQARHPQNLYYQSTA